MDQGWEESQQWYDTLVGTHGHYYHEQVILPQLLPLLDFKTPHFSLLDIGCGQGILARAIPAHTHYLGIDASPSLIAQAKKRSSHQFLVHDATLPFPFTQRFTHAVMLLSLQNMPLEPTLFHSCQALLSQGSLILVLNHPCFRIPRQSSWMVDTCLLYTSDAADD